MDDFPPLHGLRAFAAVARHLSFTRAARDLNVQQPAVSRQIAELEDMLGHRLFRRTKPKLTPTPEGETLARAVSDGFATIADAIAEIRGRGRLTPLIVDVSIGFASCWLLSRIAKFQTRYPDIEVRLVTHDSFDSETLRRRKEDFSGDIAIVFGDKMIANAETRLLFAEEVFPVCAPVLLGSRENLSPTDLTQFPLLVYDEPKHRADWANLMAPAGLRPSEADAGHTFNSYIVYIQAILDGRGVGIGWGVLMDDLIQAGRLRRVTDLTRRTDRGYFTTIPATARDPARAQVFADWLAEEVAREPCPTDAP